MKLSASEKARLSAGPPELLFILGSDGKRYETEEDAHASGATVVAYTDKRGRIVQRLKKER